MIGKKLESVEQVPVFQVKEILKERSSLGELTYEQNLAYEYSKKFSKVTKAKGEKLLKELTAVEELDKKLVIKIVDILPADKDDLQLLLPKGTSIDDAKAEEILEIVSKYIKK
jgi:DNA-directed RNA polymerase subunit F